MRISWFSPLMPARTDVAHYTARILPALSKEAEVTLWTDASAWDRSLEQKASVRKFETKRMPWPELNYADINFYNLGNNPLYHSRIWQVSRLQPGIVVLHDFRLQHFFDGVYRVEWRDLSGYMAEMGRYYGEEGRRAARESYRNAGRDIDRMAEAYPLTRLALNNAFGVVTHTRAAYEELKSLNRWLVAYAPLPFPARAHTKNVVGRKTTTAITTRTGSEIFKLILFGHIGRNRRLDQLFDALARFPERERFRLDIYGEVEERQALRRRLRELDLKRIVQVHGFVPEAELDHALDGAHLAVNLRFPTMGEASGSQLRIWSHALPSLVTEVGWYATLPKDAVVHIRLEYEVEDIQAHLGELLRDPARFARMGERGREILEQEHAPETYARTLVEMAAEAPAFRAHAAVCKLTERAGSMMSPWMNTDAPESALARLSEQIRALALGKD